MREECLHIGDLILSDQTILKSLPKKTDLNTSYNDAGLRVYYHGQNCTNAPFTGYGFVLDYYNGNDNSGWQADIVSTMSEIHMRRKSGGTWGSWCQIWGTENVIVKTGSISVAANTESMIIANLNKGIYVVNCQTWGYSGSSNTYAYINVNGSRNNNGAFCIMPGTNTGMDSCAIITCPNATNTFTITPAVSLTSINYRFQFIRVAYL